MSPGAIRIGTTGVGKHEQDDASTEHRGRAWVGHDDLVQSATLLDDQTASPVRPFYEIPDLLASRTGLQQRLDRLDTSWLLPDETTPVVLTLTLSPSQRHVSASGLKRTLGRFRRAYRRAWGGEIRAAWKVEFDEWRTPRTHLLMSAPSGIATDAAAPFDQWAAQAWKQSCRDRRATCTLDYTAGQSCDDAEFFTRYGVDDDASDDYRDAMPEAWTSPGMGPSRFWGVWPLDDVQSSRSEIREWSSRSRSRMIEHLASLDYRPLFYRPGCSAAMVTLTLPGDWQTVAPTGRDFKKIIERFKSRYQHAWGHKITGIWKLEFQRRGAPHLHILMSPPAGLAHGTGAGGGRGFQIWLGEAWAAACAHPDPEQRARHVKAGTNVSFDKGARATDPKRVAIYFTKHSAPGGASSKEYQHVVPREWQGPGLGPGRFWGVWGLEKATATVQVSPDDAITAARVLRRWSRAQGLTRRVRVWRPRYDDTTGEMRGSPWRYSTVRAVRMARGRGFICLNDAPAMLSEISRYLDSRPPPSPAPTS